MSIYDPLRDSLLGETRAEVTYSFECIEKLIGRHLPTSAQTYSWWWDNEDPAITRHAQCRSWRAAGYDATPHIGDRTVTFRKSN